MILDILTLIIVTFIYVLAGLIPLVIMRKIFIYRKWKIYNKKLKEMKNKGEFVVVDIEAFDYDGVPTMIKIQSKEDQLQKIVPIVFKDKEEHI